MANVITVVASSDVDVDKPDEKSIMTYVAQFLKCHPERHHSDSEGPSEEEVTWPGCHTLSFYTAKILI